MISHTYQKKQSGSGGANQPPQRSENHDGHDRSGSDLPRYMTGALGTGGPTDKCKTSSKASNGKGKKKHRKIPWGFLKAIRRMMGF